jgi:hypothetical protein
LRHREYVCSAISNSLQLSEVVFPLATAASICRSKFTTSAGVLLPSRHPALLEVQILSKQLAKKMPSTPLHFPDIPATRKLHFADIKDAMAKVPSFTAGHNAFEIVLHVNRA